MNVNANKVKLTGDSTIDLSPALLEKYNVSTLPLYITMGDKSLQDGVSITPDDIYEYVKSTGQLPKTAAPSVDDFITFFKRQREEYDAVIHFNISSEFSSSHQNALIAAKEIPMVFPIDSRNLSTGSSMLLLTAHDMLQSGSTVHEVVNAMSSLHSKVDASFVIDSLKYLHKGGRCSSVAALGANVLKLKPCILVEDGKMNVGKKYRGAYDKCIVEYVHDKLANRSDIRLDRIFVTHTKCSADTINLVKKTVLELQPFAEILETTAGCTITNHCGEGTLGILFMKK